MTASVFLCQTQDPTTTKLPFNRRGRSPTNCEHNTQTHFTDPAVTLILTDDLDICTLFEDSGDVQFILKMTLRQGFQKLEHQTHTHTDIRDRTHYQATFEGCNKSRRPNKVHIYTHSADVKLSMTCITCICYYCVLLPSFRHCCGRRGRQDDEVGRRGSPNLIVISIGKGRF